MRVRQSPQSEEFPIKGELTEKLREKGGKVLVFLGQHDLPVYSKNFSRRGGKPLGEIYNKKDERERIFSEFLNKFGRRLFFDDAMDSFFENRYQRWEIDFQVLSAAYRFCKENPQEFEKLINKARNGKEFLMAVGIS